MPWICQQQNQTLSHANCWLCVVVMLIAIFQKIRDWWQGNLNSEVVLTVGDHN